MIDDDSFDPDLWAVAVHEAGHDLVASTFGLESRAIATSSQGVCLHTDTELPLAQTAAILFAGLLAQAICVARTAWHPVPAVPLSPLENWCRAALRIPSSTIPGADMFALHAWPFADVLKGCELAFRILSERKDYLRSKARLLHHLALCRCEREGATDDQCAVEMFEVAEQQRRQAQRQAEREKEWQLKVEQIKTQIPPPITFPAEHALAVFIHHAADLMGLDCNERWAAFNQFAIFKATDEGRNPFREENFLHYMGFFEKRLADENGWLRASEEFLAWHKNHNHASAEAMA